MKQLLTKTLFVLLMTLPTMAFAQVKGVVYDKNTDEPLVGVSVMVKGQSVGTMTDIDGNFNIKANAKDVLVFLRWLQHRRIQCHTQQDHDHPNERKCH